MPLQLDDAWDVLAVRPGGVSKRVSRMQASMMPPSLRTSDATASAQRASAVHEKDVAELSDLQKALKDATAVLNETEKNLTKLDKQQKELTPKVESVISDSKNKKMALQSFRDKFSRYLTPGKCT